ncbi:MAG: catalase family peroxidase [Bacteroidetes bacterium]|nr:catalase family peroxidase [Bacteroidota bacterium]
MKKNKSTRQIIFALLISVASGAQINAQVAKDTSSSKDLVNALHAAFGEHHARAVHSKGVILEGTFTPSKDAAAITKAFHLQKQSSKVIVRFSDFTGIPDIPDNSGAANPRGLGIKFIMPDGRTTDIISHSFNGFPTATSDEFRQLLIAIGESGPDAPKPNAVDKFLATHPVAKKFLTTQHIPASYATIDYFGVNTFQFTNSKGKTHYIRYQLINEAGDNFLTAEQSAKQGANYLIDEIKQRIAKSAVKFKLYAQIAEAGDDTNNPSVAWPDARKKVLLGEIIVTTLSNNTMQEDKAFVINPGNVPDGIAIADDMLKIRAGAYPISVKERQ